MKSVLCDFSDRKDHSKNLLKYKYNLDVEKSLIQFLRELFVDIDIPDDEEFLEKCDIFKIKLSNMIYNLIAFVQFKYTTNLHLSDNYNFKSTLLATKYNHEHLSQNDVNELKSKTYSIDEVNDAIKNFICKELPYGYKPYKELKKLLETKMEVYLYRKHIKDKISAYKLYKYIYEIINIELDLDYGIDKERIPDSIQEEDIRQQGNIHALKFNNNDYVYSASSSSGTIGIKKDHSAVAEIFYKKLMKCYETPESRKESFECFKLKHGFLDPYYDDNFFK